ncbi:hypothetical protein [Paenibacillus sp. FSL R7-0331]|nr:hypothetical protein [Paenibacillus sp. FSL R7-0331]
MLGYSDSYGNFDATDIITHRLPISRGEHAYKVLGEKEEDCIKVIL